MSLAHQNNNSICCFFDWWSTAIWTYWVFRNVYFYS